MALSMQFSEEKDQLLKAMRGIGFEEIITAIKGGDLLADIAHLSKKYVHQHLYVVKIGLYAYAVPYVVSAQTGSVFLKTAYPSRALTKKFTQGDKP